MFAYICIYACICACICIYAHMQHLRVTAPMPYRPMLPPCTAVTTRPHWQASGASHVSASGHAPRTRVRMHHAYRTLCCAQTEANHLALAPVCLGRAPVVAVPSQAGPESLAVRPQAGTEVGWFATGALARRAPRAGCGGCIAASTPGRVVGSRICAPSPRWPDPVASVPGGHG